MEVGEEEDYIPIATLSPPDESHPGLPSLISLRFLWT